MLIKNNYYNINFDKDIILPKNNDEYIYKIQETLKNLPAFNIIKDQELLKKTINKVSKFSEGKTVFLVFGTGGSNLSAKALINILQEKQKTIIEFFDNIDPINFKNRIQQIDLKSAGFIIISKSGSTPETLSQFGSLIEIFSQKKLLDFLYKNSLIITEDKPNPLLNIAHSNNCLVLNHEDNIGGRYSVFSNVGMVPAILAGLNVEQIHKGAFEEINKFFQNEYLYLGQFLRFQNINKKITNSVLMTYSDALFYFGKWYLQLWAESIGKDNKGITAIHAIGTTDQHSQLQLYLDGPQDKFFTFFTTNHAHKGFKLHSKTMKDNNIDYLVDKTMGDLMQAEQKATIDTFKQNKFSLREINIEEINEFTIGRLMAFSIMETVATCLYYDVNPFNQPAVEQGKLLTKKYLS